MGKAGQLLTRIIEAMGLNRQDVFIANCLKCRPPDNRNPLPTEIAACRPKLMTQLQVIQPKVIVTLGKFATQTLLPSYSKATGCFPATMLVRLRSSDLYRTGTGVDVGAAVGVGVSMGLAVGAGVAVATGCAQATRSKLPVTRI